MGLGAKQGGSLTEGQCTGLDVFQSLLGRLNGKSEEVLKKEQSSRDDLKRMQYTESRWGTMRFVNGGVLLGKQIESIIKPEDGISESKIKLEPKIKVEDENQETTVVTARIEKTRVKEESTENEGVVLEVNGKKGKKKTKDNKRKRSEEKKSAKASGTSEPQTLGTAEHSQRIPEGGDEGKRAKKEEKLRRRAERAKRKLEHKERKLAKSSKSTNEQDTSDLVPTNPAKVLIEEPISRSIPIPLKASSGRHAVRQRYIQHKKMAMMDPKALNEVRDKFRSNDLEEANESQIFMIKAK